MQAVILAAGRGTRMDELTESVPKPMLEVLGKPLLEYKLEALPNEIEEIIIVVGYLGGTIQKHFGGEFSGKRVLYVEQDSQGGTADALWKARDLLHDRFLVLNGDDIYPQGDMESVIAPGDVWRVLVQQKPHMHRSGEVQIDDSARVTGIAEGDMGEEPGLASTNMFYLDMRLFTQPMVPMKKGNREFGLPQTIIAAARALDIPIEAVFTDSWIEINTPRDLIHASDILKNGKK